MRHLGQLHDDEIVSCVLHGFQVDTSAAPWLRPRRVDSPSRQSLE